MYGVLGQMRPLFGTSSFKQADDGKPRFGFRLRIAVGVAGVEGLESLVFLVARASHSGRVCIRDG